MKPRKKRPGLPGEALAKSGFTLVEILLVIAIIGVLAGIVASVMDVRAVLINSQDSKRASNAKQIETAMYQHIVDQWEILNETQIPEGKGNEKNICKKGVTGDSTCVNLDGLVPDFLPVLPVDPAEPSTSNYTGYKVYTSVGRPRIVAARVGELPGGGLGGAGTSGDPYKITSCAELLQTENDMTAYYVLMNSVDCAAETFIPLGLYPAVDFTGQLDGAGYNIANITYNDGGSFFGLIYKIAPGGVVRDVNLLNFNVTIRNGGLAAHTNQGIIEDVSATGTINGDRNLGGLVGSNFPGGIIRRSSANVTINTSSTGPSGGLVAGNAGGTIEDSYATGDVNGGAVETGGLVGMVSGGTISNSYATGDVSGTDGVGGLVGWINLGNQVSNSFATGRITAATDRGVLFGYAQTISPSITDSFWYDQAGDDATDCIGYNDGTGNPDSCGGPHPNESDFYNESNAPMAGNWDFATVWQSNNPTGYPTLQ